MCGYPYIHQPHSLDLTLQTVEILVKIPRNAEFTTTGILIVGNYSSANNPHVMLPVKTYNSDHVRVQELKNQITFLGIMGYQSDQSVVRRKESRLEWHYWSLRCCSRFRHVVKGVQFPFAPCESFSLFVASVSLAKSFPHRLLTFLGILRFNRTRFLKVRGTQFNQKFHEAFILLP
jgi:hypothetical protein